MTYEVVGPRCTTCAAEGKTRSVYIGSICYAHFMLLSAVDKRTLKWEIENSSPAPGNDVLLTELDALFALDAAPEVEPATASIPKAWGTATTKLDALEDGSKTRAVGRALGVDGDDLTRLCMARVEAVMEAASVDDSPLDEEGEARMIAGHLYGLAVEMFATGVELGRAERHP